MVVGTIKIDEKELALAIRKNDLETFAVSLLPDEFKSNRLILNNQKYYLALKIRELTQIPYRRRTACIKKLLEGVRVVGVLNELHEASELLEEMEKL